MQWRHRLLKPARLRAPAAVERQVHLRAKGRREVGHAQNATDSADLQCPIELGAVADEYLKRLSGLGHQLPDQIQIAS